MKMAYKKVKANKGAGGIDGINVENINEYLKENWIDIKTKILKRKYKPQPVLRVEIPKPNGGVRNLGIPTVVDRIIEQAIAQVLSDMDSEIEQLEKKLAKYQQIKQGMMQELLTGKTRLL